MRTNALFTTGLATVAVCGLALADSVSFDMAGINSWDGYGSANNDNVNTGGMLAGATITGFEWSGVMGDGLGGASWGNEMSFAFLDDASGGWGVGFFPAEGSGSAGGVWGPADGSIDLASNGISAHADANGEYNIQFYEGYDDAADTIDASYTAGTFTIHYAVPAPGALALLGLAGLAGTRRRRH